VRYGGGARRADRFYSGRVSQKVSVSKTVHAPAERIFALLTDPAKHALIDGSGTVVADRGERRTLVLGSTFGMDMKMGMSYKIKNRVVEYEQDRLIAWRHFVGHRWRWELEPIDEETTKVTETFDWSTTPMGPFLKLVGFPKRNREGIVKTLDRLESVLAAE
jgi:uncharacterized protein YndB with AHSA1/START domain